ncbi:MAG: methyltransferase family protein [Promethearchaeota archaeon]
MCLFGLELFPMLTLGLLNGWILLTIFFITELVLVLSFPKSTRGRLFEYAHSKWARHHRVMLIIGKTFGLLYILLLFFSPLKLSSPFFYLGMIFYIVGLSGFVIAIINFRSTPMNQPVTHGLYRYSRNPQILTILITMLGISLAVGSGMALILLLLSTVFSRVRIIEEEKACLAQYGEAYREYLERVPRYLIIRTKVSQ